MNLNLIIEMNNSHILSNSTNFMHGYLSSQGTKPSSNMSVSQSLVFYDKSRHESEIMEVKKEVGVLPSHLRIIFPI